jgi:hypothetical protein
MRLPNEPVRKVAFLWARPVCTVRLIRDSERIGTVCALRPFCSAIYRGGGMTMQPGAVWIIYTLMFGYPVPTHDEHEFTNRAACEIHKHSYSEQIVEAFKLVCSTK